jgi:hypothetical protein
VGPEEGETDRISYSQANQVATSVYLGWLSRSLLVAIHTGSLTVTPQILSARTASAAPTATSCTMLMTVGCWCPQLTSVLTCHLLKRKPSPQCAWPLPPIECNTKHSVTYTQRKRQRCGTGVDNEQHLLFECSHVAL